MNLNMLLQIPETVAVNNVEEPANQSISLIDTAMKGGWIMIPLLLLSIVAIYIFFERLTVIRAASKYDKSFMDKIKDYIQEGKIDAALNLCRNNNTPCARMIEKGIQRLGRPMSDMLDGACTASGLVKMAKEFEMPGIAITDHGYMGGTEEFHRKLVAENLTPIIGVEAYVSPTVLTDRNPAVDFIKGFHLVLLAENQKGYHNLCKIMSVDLIDFFLLFCQLLRKL